MDIDPRGSDDQAPRITAVTPATTDRIVDNLGASTFELTLTEPITVPLDAVGAWGLASGDLGIAAASFDADTLTLRVELARAVTADVVTLVIDYAVTDLAGNALDGEIDAPAAATFPSGNGVAGGQAVFRFEALQGDANRDGVVDFDDANLLMASLGQSDGMAGFDPNADLNGDGVVNVLDVAIWANGNGLSLPTDDATSPTITQITPDPASPRFSDIDEVVLSFDEAVDASRVTARDLFSVSQAGELRPADDAVISPDGQAVTFIFDPPLPRCDEYTFGISNAIADASGALLAIPAVDLVISGLVIPPAPTLDSFPTLTDQEIVTLTGTAIGSTQVRVVGPEDVYLVPVVNDAYTVDVELPTDFVHVVFATGVSPCGFSSAPAPAEITRDTSSPMISIDFPEVAQEITTDTVTVLGRVGDEFAGTEGLTVTVNGLPAEVDVGSGMDGTFVAMGVPLTIGQQSIEVVATDVLGNTRSRPIDVERIIVPPATPEITVLAGDGQSAQVLTELPTPLTVQLTRANGDPLAGKVVTFNVERNNGLIAPAPGQTATGSTMLQVFTDNQGIARAYWRLGSSAGSGNNRVSVRSQDLVGTVFFCASGTRAPAGRILIGDMNNQRAEAGAPLPQPLTAFVTDGDAGNPVAGVPVTFTVTRGDGVFPNGANTLTVNSRQNGRAEAPFVLGQTAGLNQIEATFAGNPGLPATFSATGVARVEDQPTTLTGLVLDNANRPIGGALATLTVTLDFAAGPDTIILGPVESDVEGRFTFDASVLPPDTLNDTLPGGPAKLLVSGVFATSLGGEPIDREWAFPYVGYDIVLVENAVNRLPDPVWLPELDPANEVFYDGTQDVELTVAGIEGLVFRVAAGSMTREDGTRPTPSDPEIIRLNQVHFDELPMPLPNGNAFPFAWTLQPKNARFDPPIEVQLPNLTGLPASSIAQVLQWNNDVAEFQVVGTGRVSEDGSVIVTEPGSGITVAGWGGGAPPPPPPTEAENCTGSSIADALVGFIGQTASDAIDAFTGISAYANILRAAANTVRSCAQPIRDALVDGLDEIEADEAIACLKSAKQLLLAGINATPVDRLSRVAGRIQFAANTFANTLDGFVASGCATGGAASLARFGSDVASLVGRVAGMASGLSASDALAQSICTKLDFAESTIGAIQDSERDRSVVGSRNTDDLIADLLATLDEIEADTAVLDGMLGELDTEATSSTSLADSLLDTAGEALQEIAPEPEIQGASITIAGRTSELNSIGGFFVSNLPASGRLVRVSGFVEDASGQRETFVRTPFFDLIPNQRILVPFAFEQSDTAFPEVVELETQIGQGLLPVGGNTELDVSARFSNGVVVDVGERALGTEYFSSNSAVASISEAGVVEAISPGVALLTVTNTGSSEVRRVEVVEDVQTSQFRGFVELDNMPFENARIETVSAFGGNANSLGDGSFVFDLNVPGPITLRLRATVVIEDETFLGLSDPIEVVPGGVTDVGIIQLRPVPPGPIFGNPEVAVQDRPAGLAIADFDDDGDLDFATGTQNGSTVVVRFNEEAATFFDGPSRPTGSRPEALVAADVTGDGVPDLISANSSSNSVSVYRSNVDRTFTLIQTVSSLGSQPRGIAAGDLDGDGDQDLVVASGGGGVRVLTNNGSGLFSVTTLALTGGPRGVAIADMDGDLDLDLVVTQESGGSVTIFRNDGTGTFTQGVTAAAGRTPRAIAIGDIDGDGRRDVAVANFVEDTVTVLFGGPNATFASTATMPVGNGPQAVGIADVDSDTDLDIVATNFFDGDFTVLRNQGGGMLLPDRYNAGQGALTLGIADLDGDADLDLAAVNNTADTVSILLNRGDGTFQDDDTFEAPEEPRSLAVASINDDEWPDLVVVGRDADAVQVLYGEGDQSFVPGPLVAVGIQPEDVAVGDLNGDERPDAIVANSGSNSVSILLNDEAFNLVSAGAVGVGDLPRAVALGDIDGDEDLDAAVANTLSGTVSILENDGSASFTVVAAIAVGQQPRELAFGELDGQPGLDLAVVATDSDALMVISGFGDGTFRSPVSWSTVGDPVGVAISDFDGDGDQDIAVTSINAATARLHRNNGTGGFGDPEDPTAAFVGEGVTFGDPDLDGDPDVVAANSGLDNVAIALNEDGNELPQIQLFGVGESPASVMTADLDNDGDTDIAAVNSVDDTVSILWGRFIDEPSGGRLLAGGDGSDLIEMRRRRAAMSAPVDRDVVDSIERDAPRPERRLAGRGTRAASVPAQNVEAAAGDALGAEADAEASPAFREQPGRYREDGELRKTTVRTEEFVLLTDQQVAIDALVVDEDMMANVHGERAETRIDPATGVPRAYFVSPDGTVVELPTLGGRFARATGINESGDVIGFSETEDGAVEGFVWTRDADAVESIGVLDGERSASAFWLGDALVVADADREDGSVSSAIWTRGDGLLDLNTLVAGNGIRLGIPLGVTADGRVLIDALTENGERRVVSLRLRAFETLQGDLDADGDVDRVDLINLLQMVQDRDPTVDFNGDGRVDSMDFIGAVQQTGVRAREVELER